MVYDFDGRSVIVTGAASGIGRASARTFAEAGADVAIADIDEDRGSETAETLDQTVDGSVTSIATDVSDADDVEDLIDRVVDRFGRLDVLHNNAGLSQSQVAEIPMDVDEIPTDAWDRLQAVNLRGPYLGAKFAVPHMRRQGSGVIINTSSAATLRMADGQSAYNAGKGGVNTLTRQLAFDLADDGIRVNAICPGPVDSRMFGAEGKSDEWVEAVTEAIPLGGLLDPQELADTVVFLASDRARRITGAILPVDGGFGL